jgi:hypothetical protein
MFNFINRNNKLLGKLLNLSFIIRIILNLIIFKISNNILIHYILLFIIDTVDNAIPQLIAIYYLIKKKEINLSLLYNILLKPLIIISDENVKYYRYVDKLADIISYILFLNILPLDINKNFYNNVILFRIIGMFILYITENNNTLIYFPDLFKEFIGYNLFINKNPSNYIFIIIYVLKIIFEYFKLYIIESR